MQGIKPRAAFAAIMALGGCMLTVPNGDDVARAGIGPRLSAFETPDGYSRLFSPALHNFRVGLAEAGDPVRRGRSSERFELRDGDCGGNDCGAPRARAEIEMSDQRSLPRLGRDIWYGWSFYNATIPSFERENSLRLVFGQWTMGGQNRPIFRFIQLGEDEGDFEACDPWICTGLNNNTKDVVVQLSDIAEELGWGDAQNDGYICRLFDMDAQRGKWTDLMVNTNFGTDYDGYLRIWVDGQLVCNYEGPLVSSASVASRRLPEHRRGIYSSWTKRWDRATDGAARPTLIAYYDEFRIGKTRDDVDVRHADIIGLRPID